MLPEYLYYLLPFLNIAEYAQPASKGNTLNKAILEKIRIPVPSLQKQREFIQTMQEREAKARDFREKACDIERTQRDDAHRFIADQ